MRAVSLWPTPAICTFCAPGKTFATHAKSPVAECATVLDEGLVNGVPVVVLCACKQEEPVPFDSKVVHEEVAS